MTLNHLCSDILVTIFEQIPEMHHLELSLVDKKIQKIIGLLKKHLTLRGPKINHDVCPTAITQYMEHDPEIIIRIFQRFPNICKLTTSFTNDLFYKIPIHNINKLKELIITPSAKATISVDMMRLITKNPNLERLHLARHVDLETFQILETHLLTPDLKMTHLSLPIVSYPPPKIPTRHLPNLELLQCDASLFSYEELVELKTNCPKIKALTLGLIKISAGELIKFISNNPQIEKLTIHCFYKQLDLKVLTTYTKNLKFLCLIAHPKFGKEQLDVIRINCKELECLILDMGKGGLNSANFRHFLKVSPNLKYFSILNKIKDSGNGFWNMTDESLEKLYSEFPSIQQVTSGFDSFYLL